MMLSPEGAATARHHTRGPVMHCDMLCYGQFPINGMLNQEGTHVRPSGTWVIVTGELVHHPFTWQDRCLGPTASNFVWVATGGRLVTGGHKAMRSTGCRQGLTSAICLSPPLPKRYSAPTPKAKEVHSYSTITATLGLRVAAHWQQ